MSAANWFALQNSAAQEGRATFKFNSAAAQTAAVWLRIKRGPWKATVNGTEAGSATSEQADWTWVKLQNSAALNKGANTLMLSTAAENAAIDKVCVGAQPNFQPQGCMYLDTKAPAAATNLKVERLDSVLIKLRWTAPAERDLRYCNVYYSAAGANPSINAKCRIASLPVGCAQYLDFGSRPGAAGNYAITAVDRFGNESAPVFGAVPAK
jgi:hypothetical protein